jgi:hypothetical protein
LILAGIRIKVIQSKDGIGTVPKLNQTKSGIKGNQD